MSGVAEAGIKVVGIENGLLLALRGREVLAYGPRCPSCAATGTIASRAPPLRLRCETPTCRVMSFRPGVPL